MAKIKNPNDKILERLRGVKSDYQCFTAQNGLTVQVMVKNGALDLSSEVKIGTATLPLRDLLQGVEIVRLAGTGGKCVCVFHGAYKANNMGCQACRNEIATRAGQAAAENTYDDGEQA